MAIVSSGIEIEFMRFDLHGTEQERLLPELIFCYQRVFADSPWDEWLQCSNKDCAKVYGTKDIQTLRVREFVCCDGHPLVERWTAPLVAHDLRKELVKDSSCWLALHEGHVVGFCWGYPITAEKLELKLGIKGLATALHTHFPEGRFAYQDEIGVLPGYRDKKIAKELFRNRLSDFVEQGLTVGVVRTKEFPPSVTFSWFTEKLGYEVIERYSNPDRRVILARDISNFSVS